MKKRHLVPLSLFVTASGISPFSYAFNSDEHKLIGDTGASRVVIPSQVVLPASQVQLKTLTATDKTSYLTLFQDAKNLAVGFRTNDQTQYSSTKGKVQDNCYWYNYGQLAMNKNIYIPATTEIPAKNLLLTGNVGATPSTFTFGELVALYGDYRRTVSCDTSANCFLTDANISTVYFNKGNVVNTAFYCPDPIAADRYLKFIASGVVPPLGSLGNATSNTTTDTDYSEAGWWGDEVMRLVNANDWHFSTVSNSYYVGLHRIALYYVEKAINDPKYWNVALHYEANALHSLTDFFAFGHEVTNRDITSYGILTDNALLATDAIRWQSAANSLGGAQRQGNNSILMTSTLPSVTAPYEIRNDFLTSYQGSNPLTSWGLYSKYEHDYHDGFNSKGAIVRNLNGDQFRVYGDAKFRNLTATDKEPIFKAVASSLQSLFDAQVAMRQGYPLSEIAKPGSTFFKALRYIPVYVASDQDNYFWGTWVRSAKAIDEIAGGGLVPSNWGNCQMPYLWGGGTNPVAKTAQCSAFTPYRALPFQVNGNWLYSGAMSTTAEGNQYYKFSVTQPTNIDIRLSAILADPYIYLLNAQGATIATDDNSGGGLTARLIYNNLPAGNYTIVAATGANFRTDSFVLTATGQVATANAGTALSKPSTTEVMVTLKDSNGNPVPYRDVVFIVSSGRATIVTPRGTTDANGTFRSSVTNFLDSLVQIQAQFDAVGDSNPETYVVNGSPVSFATGG